MTDAGDDLRPVLLDLLAGAAAVADLPPPQVAAMSSSDRARPAGMPSMMAVRDFPCDSPAVKKRNIASLHLNFA